MCQYLIFIPKIIFNDWLYLCLGSASANAIKTLADETMKNDYLGIMVWYTSVVNGLQYDSNWDTSEQKASIDAYTSASDRFKTFLKYAHTTK